MRLPRCRALALLALLLVPALATAERKGYTRNVAIMIWNGAEVLDWGGPSEVFESASRFGQAGGEPAFNVYTVSKSTDSIKSQRFVEVVPQYSIETAPAPDIIILPGGGTGSVLGDPEFLAWTGEAVRGAEIALSVCTGAFILARNGFLDGKQVTTWYGATDALERQYPAATVQRGRRFVDNGQVITTAGVSAGIDGSLHVVARLLGRAVADRTAEYMEYRWTPEPYLAQAYSLLNPSLDAAGRDLQQAGLDLRANDAPAAIAGFVAYLREHPDSHDTWYQLGTAYYQDGRFTDAGEAFSRAAESEARRSSALYNAACSYARGDDGDRALDSLERAVAAGFSNPDFILADADLASLRDTPRFRTVIDAMR